MIDDLISRQDAIDAVKKHYRAYDNDLLELIAFDIERLPSAQPEIVRCKDCFMHGTCRFEQWLGLDGYCSKAERRDDD